MDAGRARLLRRHAARETFFLLAGARGPAPALVRRMVDEDTSRRSTA